MIKARLSPDQLFAIHKTSSSVCPLETWMESKLFWTKEFRKMSDQGAVKWTVHDKPWKFQATTNDIFWRFKNTWLTVRIDYDRPDRVHLFDKKSDDFIGEIQARLALNKNNKKEILQQYGKVVNKLLKYEREKRKTDQNVASGRDPIIGIEYLDLDAQILRKSISNGPRDEEE